MFSIKSLWTVRTGAIAGAVVLGLGLSTGELTAASVKAGPIQTPGVASVARQMEIPGITSTPIYADNRPDVFARAGKARDAFGFPAGPRRTGRHVHDGFQSSDYDEVSEVDSAGNAMSITQFDAAGGLVSAVRFDAPPTQASNDTEEVAVKAAQRGLITFGMRVLGQARLQDDAVAGGWDVHWNRVEAGVSVRGDETSVHVWPDGRIQSVARVEHKLDAAPVHKLAQNQADQVADGQMKAWFPDNATGYSAEDKGLQWVGPNSAFDPSKVGSVPEAYRMAWVVNVKPAGPVAESVRLITLYIDAGNGMIIGGDVVE